MLPLFNALDIIPLVCINVNCFHKFYKKQSFENQNPQLFLKVPLLILLLVKVPFFNMMSLEMVLAVSRKEAIIWLPAVINIYL